MNEYGIGVLQHFKRFGKYNPQIVLEISIKQMQNTTIDNLNAEGGEGLKS